MHKLLAAIGITAFALFLAFGVGAQNTLVPTRPNGDSSNAAASTQFVQNAFGGGSSLNFPAPISGTVNSGGIPYAASTTSLAFSAALAVNQLVAGGGPGAAPFTFTLGGDCTLA